MRCLLDEVITRNCNALGSLGPELSFGQKKSLIKLLESYSAVIELLHLLGERYH